MLLLAHLLVSMLSMPAELVAMTSSMFIASLVPSVLFATYYWHSKRVVTWLETATQVRVVRLEGRPMLDMSLGVCIPGIDEHGSCSVVINPEYWNLLPAELSEAYKNETVVIGCHASKVPPSNLPRSLVWLKTQSNVVGLGCRVSWGKETYLLTAYHVWNRLGGVDVLAANGLETSISSDWSIYSACADRRLDYVLVKVPSQVWSSLSVKSSPIKPPRKLAVCTLYGGSCSSKPLSTFSTLNVAEDRLKLIYGGATTAGWSGTPIFSDGAVVGLHHGCEEIGASNRGLNLGSLLRILDGCDETMFGEVDLHEIDYDDIADRSLPFDDIEITGVKTKRLAIGKSEFALFKPRRVPEFYDAEDDAENDIDYDAEFARFKESKQYLSWSKNETVQVPLNLSGAARVHTSLPSIRLAPIAGSLTADLSQKKPTECLSTELANRVVSLEKVVERILLTQSELLQSSSQSLRSLDGLREDLKRSFDLCCSKLADFELLNARNESVPVASSSQVSTPPQGPEGASALAGTGESAKQKSRRSRRRRKKSIAKQVQESRSQQLQSRTVKSSTST